MASEAELRRRIRKLEEQIQAIRLKQRKSREELNRQMEDRLAVLRHEFEASAKRQERETQEMLTARIRKYQEQMTEAARESLRQISEAAETLSRLQAEKMKELAECNEKLREMIDQIKKEKRESDCVQMSAAQDMFERAVRSRASASESPHEFFYQGEYDIINAHTVQIEEEIRQEMYQAAAADASSVQLEFDLLRTRVEQALSEWLMAFQDYAAIIRSLDARIRQLEEYHITTAAGSFVMIPAELDYWSSGTYLPFKEKISKAMEMIQQVEEMGIIPYLKKADSRKRKGIFAWVEDARRQSDELSGIITCILSERTLSDERWVLANTTVTILEEAGYQWIRRGYREPGHDLKTMSWYPDYASLREQNPLDTYELTETIQGMDQLHILFVPVRENGVVVKNECLLSLDAVTLQGQELIQEVLEMNAQRIRSCILGLKVDSFAPGNGFRCLLSEEAVRKQRPDPEKQIEFLEKKYH